ncbi:MAG: hypothetical protein HY077_07175 [Elusimicrobia bacterium]|nr:hypothetical protein [Elusimicrobiota bacterium]
MAYRPIALLCAVLAAAPSLAAAGPTAESASLSAGTVLSQAFQFTGKIRFFPSPAVPSRLAEGASFEDSSSIDKIHLHTLKAGGISSPKPSFQAAALAQPTSTVALGALLNRNLRAGLNAKLGGKDVWLSGVFDRGTYDKAKNAYVDPNAYVSLLIEGDAAVRIYNVKDLLTSPQTIAIGSGQFKLKLSPDLSDQLDSEIVVINLANNHKDRISLRDLLNAVGGSGEAFTLGAQVYKVFYYDEVKNGRMDPAGKLFAFIATDPKGEFHVFMIPGELIPSDRTATFKMLDDKPLGLKKAGDKLLIFANP